MKLLWLCILLPLVAFLWVLSRIQFRISLHRPNRDRARWVPSTVTPAEKSVNAPMPDHVVAMIKEGRHDEAMKAMRDLTGATLKDGRGEVKSWTSDDGTVHVESRTVTFETEDIPPEVIDQIRNGDVAGAIKRLREEKTLSPPAGRRSIESERIDVPSKDEINDPTPKPFSIDE